MASKRTIARRIIIFLAVAFTCGTLIMSAALTRPSYYGQSDDYSVFGESTNDSACKDTKGNSLAFRMSVETPNGTTTYSCPWSKSVLALVFVSLAFCLVFLSMVVLRFKIKSVKCLRYALLFGLIVSVLLAISVIVMGNYLGGLEDLPKDYKYKDTSYTYSRMVFKGNIAMMFITAVFVSMVFVIDVWRYKKNSKRATGEQGEGEKVPHTKVPSTVPSVAEIDGRV